ncbi:MAG TPA: hypothetical protein VFR67_27590 [Pilimelia sp.]|nr:hypothetical protein [Pilimelia sp.]
MADRDGGFWLSRDAFPAIRIRLVEEIHRRAYHDSGVEVLPTAHPDRHDQPYAARTPHCRQGDRQLALLSWTHGAWPGPARDTFFASWSDLVGSAFAALRVDAWRTRRHRDCFHRRGKARYDLVFAVAARLVGSAPVECGAQFWALDGRTDTGRGQARPFLDLAMRCHARIPGDRPPRHLAVICCGDPLALLRSDGYAMTTSGDLTLDGLWWQGRDLNALAQCVRAVAGHPHTECATPDWPPCQ